MSRPTLGLLLVCLALLDTPADSPSRHDADWPEWMRRNRDAVHVPVEHSPEFLAQCEADTPADSKPPSYTEVRSTADSDFPADSQALENR